VDRIVEVYERSTRRCIIWGFSASSELGSTGVGEAGRYTQGEKYMKKITRLMISAAFVALVLTGTAWSQESTTSLIKQLKEDTDRFAKSLDKALDRSSVDGSQLEDEINGYVKEFRDAIGTLKDDWENKREAKDSAEGLMARGRTINNFLKKHDTRFKSAVHTEWKSVKLDVGRIAKAHNLKAEW